jgi:aryl-alcohol dehydrogenase-like predicted oxidoreductase
VSLVDQGSRELRLADLARRGIGVIAKRTLGNGPWSAASPPDDRPEAEYQRRFARLELPPPDDGAWAKLALRFAAFSPGVDVALVGTRSVERLRDAADAVAAGPLPDEVVDAIVARWRARAFGWRGIV